MELDDDWYKHRQDRLQNSEELGQIERRGVLAAKEQKIFRIWRIKLGKLFMVHFMKPPDFEALGVMRPLGP